MKYMCLIQVYRKQKKINQQELADLLGITRKTLSGIENGNEPGLFLAFQIAEILDSNINDLWIKI